MSAKEFVRVVDTAFMEFASSQPEELIETLRQLGFQAAGLHRSKRMTWMRQGGVNFIVNAEPGSHAAGFAQDHGPSCAGMAFMVHDADASVKLALALGAEPAIAAAG